MNENATRSVNLTMLMIVSVCLPMIGAFDQPVERELNSAADRMETPPSPCQGYDACRGTDAGENSSAAMDLTADFAFGAEETNIYWGNFSATAYASGADTGEDHNDVYLIDLPVGYGFTASVDWNYTGNSSNDANAYAIGIGPADGSMTWLAWGGSGSWGRSYNSQTGHIAMSTDGDTSYSDGSTYFYDWPGASGQPAEIMGEPMLVWVWCYRCYDSAVADDYQLNITAWPSDGGLRGDVREPTGLMLLDMPDVPFSWTYQADTFDLAAGTQADVVVTYCDVWCTAETTLDITKPDGTTDSFNLVNYFTGELVNYTAPGTYLVEKFDSWGDGGMGLEVTTYIGDLTGILSVSDVVFEDAISGHVDTNDNQDIYAVWIPENSFANLTLSWEDTSVDIDLRLYTDYDSSTGVLSGQFDQSTTTSHPEFVDLGQRGPGQIVFAEVRFYSGSAGTGYWIDFQTIPGELPPCSNQDDGAASGTGVYDGSGSDATEGTWSPDGFATDVTGVIGSDGTGSFTGMVCQDLDMQDWFVVTIPANHGLYVSLEWHEGIDTNFNDTIEIESNLNMRLYYETATGYVSSIMTGVSTNPTVAATNGSSGWNAPGTLNVSTDALIMVGLIEQTSDYEQNYTVHLTTFDATLEPYESMYQNDAQMGVDAGDDNSAGTDSLNLTTMNQTFTGWGHDQWDEWDIYKIYVPNNYAMGVTVHFDEDKDADVFLSRVATWGFSSVSSSYGNSVAELSAGYTQGGQDLYLRIDHNLGGGEYEVEIEMWTTGLEPGGSQDDCGLAVTGVPNGDAADSVYPGTWDGHTFINGSDAGDFSPVDENGTMRSYWEGGTCTGWLSQGWDTYDMYSIPVPEGHYVEINYDLFMDGEDANDDNEYFVVYMLMCQQQHRACGAGAPYAFNGAYFVDTDSGYNLDEVNQISGLWPVGNLHNASGCNTASPNSVCATNFSSPQTFSHDSDGDGIGDNDEGNGTYVGMSSADWNFHNAVDDTNGWLYVYIYSFAVEDHTYEMNITFHDLANLEGGDQDDANSGRDAGPGVSSAVHVNDHLEQYQIDLLANNSTLTWDGWNHGTIDTTDRFTFDVPGHHGVFITLDRGYDADVWMILDIYTATGSSLGLVWNNQGSQTFNYSSLGVTNSQDYIMMVGVRNWGSIDTSGTDYNVSVEFYTLDSDGDGWLDETEAMCGPDLDGDGYPDGTDPNDPNDFPTDTDGDGICDAQDPDIDGDGVDNGLDDSPMDENVSADMDGDGIPDASDPDMDNDTWSNAHELVCLGYTSGAEADQSWVPADLDGDGYCDANEFSELDDDDADLYIDSDSDNDGTPNDMDAFPFDACADTDTDGDKHPDEFSESCTWINGSDTDTDLTTSNLTVDDDDDDDGHLDTYEVDCGSDPLDITNVPLDSTLPEDMSLGGLSNGLCDALDPDDDNDGWIDAIDWAPLDSTEWADADNDGQGDNRDMDDDNDGYWDSCDAADWAAAQDASQVEGVNYFTANADNGGIASNCPEYTDAFPNDAAEWYDTDGDGVGNNADLDDDGQGSTPEVTAALQDWTDEEEIACGSDPLDPSSVPVDTDGDFICDVQDEDDDGDGTLDGLDAFPFNPVESDDLDGDGTGDIADLDDDGDGWTDLEETACLSDPMDGFSVPDDADGDHTCDINDDDDDNDGAFDDVDAFPFNPFEQSDNDNDGIGDIADYDDDGDTWTDLEETACLSDPMDGFSVPSDNDGDHICDITDDDDDNDGVLDDVDAFPFNPLESSDNDGDGIGDVSDDDDDNDGWLDVTEVVCANRGGSGDPLSESETPKDSDYNLGPDGEAGTGDESAAPDGLCDAMDPDRDGDGFPNPIDPNNPTGDEDRFPDDHTEWYDANGDGQGDNANPVTLLDNVEADPGPYVGILAGIGGLGYLVVEMSRRAGGKTVAGALTGDEDFTEEFEDFDFEDEEGQED